MARNFFSSTQRISTQATQERQLGFTIVELLIVVVVIGILAAISFVSYSGIQQNAAAAVLQSDLRQASNQLEFDKVTAGGYPSDDGSAAQGDWLSKSNGTTFQYTSDGTSYCLSASSSNSSDRAFHISSTSGTVQEEVCDGHTEPTTGGGSLPVYSAVSVGDQHTCAIASGRAYCWGGGSYGKLGAGNTASSTVPVAVSTSGVFAGKTVTAISSDNFHTCAIVDGQAYCWGYDRFGQLGNGDTADSDVPAPVSITAVLAGRTVTAISAGQDHTCAIADGQAYCWGRGDYGQLGHGSGASSHVPVAALASGVMAGKTVTDISTGKYHTCVIADGQAYCWGQNGGYYGQLGHGQLGHGSSGSSNTPVAVSTSGVMAGKTVTDISAGDAHTCAVADSQAYCWGVGGNGQLGNGSTADSSSPVAVSTSGVIAGKTVTSIATGNVHTCVIADGQGYCWGEGTYGQLGSGNGASFDVPVAVSTVGVLTGKTVTAINADGRNTCAIAVGQAYCWGSGSSGRLGNGSNANSYVPAAVSPVPQP